MKKLFCSLALVGALVACRTQTTAVTDTSTPAPDCAAACATACEDAGASCEAKSSCEAKEKVCPVSGKAIN